MFIMKRILFLFCLLASMLVSNAQKSKTIFIEAESFQNKGGWVVDQQFLKEMGSPYIMAHGLGIAVKDASTTIKFPITGKYYMHVRTKNWVAQWSDKDAPGKFQVIVDGKTVNKVFGKESKDWAWSKGGAIDIKNIETKIALHDLTGFNGRCDAIIFTTDANFSPVNDLEELASYRNKMLQLPNKPRKAGKFDLVVVGGGMGGICTAISAARLGVKVALIQNRPVLGGNNSSEVRVHLGAGIRKEPWPNLGNIVNEIGPTKGGNAGVKENYEDNKKLNAVLAEENISLFLNTHANGVIVKNGKITSVLTQNIETSEKLVFKAPLFADCTGDGTIAALAGAKFMQGRESRAKFNEPAAPEVADQLTMGASVQWFSEKKENSSDFPDIKWGLDWSEAKASAKTKGDWNWETGMGIDQTKIFEPIRDYGMLVVFSNWSFVKNHSDKKNKFTNEQLKWVAYVAGKRETRRIIGDYVLTQNDIADHKLYPDGLVPTTWSLDLHYPDPENLKLFPDAPFKSIAKHIQIKPYPIPYRCLYAKDIDNLLLAGRHISVSHVALGTVRLMRTIGMMGEVLGMAASICKEEKTTPRGVYKNHFPKMEKLMEKGIGDKGLKNMQKYNGG